MTGVLPPSFAFSICDKYSDRHTMRIHGQMYLCVEPPFRTGHILIAAFCSRSIRMHLSMTRIYHEPFKVWLSYENFKEFFPDSPVSPATESSMGILPVAIIRWQIAPERTRSQNPETGVINCRLSLAFPPQIPLRPGR